MIQKIRDLLDDIEGVNDNKDEEIHRLNERIEELGDEVKELKGDIDKLEGAST